MKNVAGEKDVWVWVSLHDLHNQTSDQWEKNGRIDALDVLANICYELLCIYFIGV